MSDSHVASAISNIMFFPLFKIAFEFWKHYDAEKKDWKKQTSWKVALGKIGGTTVTPCEGRGELHLEQHSADP